jgi:tetratricopeptide (TPR) repeat protein
MRLSFFIKAFSVATALLLTCAASRAQSAADELIKKGDICDVKLQATEALKYYLPAEKLEPKNARLFVCISRQYRHLMTDAATRDEKLILGGIALTYAQRARALAPNDAEAQLAVAITYGKMLPFQGTKDQVAASPRIKEAADKALKLDPRNDTAWHILGRWQRVLAGMNPIKRALAPLFYGKLPTGTNEAAVACFQKAIEINPNRLMHYIELGIAYAQMGRPDDARRFIAKGLAMPDVEKDDPGTKQRGREVLAKLR